MSYASLMVHVELDDFADGRLAIARTLAARFDARVIGIAAQAEPLPVYYNEGFTTDSLLLQTRVEIEKSLEQAGERFRDAMKGRLGQIEWRAALRDPVPYIAEQCRAADLLIVGTGSRTDPIARLDVGDLLLQAGRPLLLVPPGVSSLEAARIFIAWKDTLEARRAIASALPLLRGSQHVVVVGIDEFADPATASRGVEDVVTWLACHGVKTTGKVVPLKGEIAKDLETLADEEGADLFVAGAYGHGRFREWVFGGVTRDVLTQTSRCRLLVH